MESFFDQPDSWWDHSFCLTGYVNKDHMTSDISDQAEKTISFCPSDLALEVKTCLLENPPTNAHISATGLIPAAL